MANAIKSAPITGPFPDGDSRNITLTRRSNGFEPERTGPQEPSHREQSAPDSVIGDLAETEVKPGADAPETNNDPAFVQLGVQSIGKKLASLTPGSDTTSLMGGLLKKVSDAYGIGSDKDADAGVQSDATANEPSEPENQRAARYTLREDPEPSTAQSAFGRQCGGLEEPVLEKDWNPAERNSDDLSR